MRVMLIHYDVHHNAYELPESTDRVLLQHVGHMPNIQLLYVAAILEQLGVEVRYLDLVGMRINTAGMLDQIKAYDPDMIALSVYTSQYHQAVSYASLCKSVAPRAKIIMGGEHLAIYPVETLRNAAAVDYGCVGEAEMMLPEFLRRWHANESLEGTPGLVWRQGEQILFSGPAPMNEDLDSCPFPARHLVPNHVYYNIISTYRNYTMFNSSRGCPFACLFCSSARTHWRGRSAENIHAEFAECYEKFGIREIDIGDSSFTVNKERVFKLCRMLVDSGLSKKVHWNVRSTVNAVNKEILEALREAGCYRIFYGIESGNEAILKEIRKPVRIEQARKMVQMTKAIGISTYGYFLIGSPGDTRETVHQTIDYAKSLPLDFATFSMVTAYPRTELYHKHYLPLVEHDFWHDFMAQKTPGAGSMVRPWTTLADDEIQLLTKQAIHEFYFRPGQIWLVARTVKSLWQLRRYTSLAWALFWNYLLVRLRHRPTGKP